jgi:hypothetical protein
MKDPRYWNRRDFAVTPNGYFTILKPTGWFSAVRLPGGYRYQVGLSERTEFPLAHENPAAASPSESTSVQDQMALGHAASLDTATPWQFMKPCTDDHRLVRLALIVLAASAITLMMLWWLLDYIPGFAIY